MTMSSRLMIRRLPFLRRKLLIPNEDILIVEKIS